MSGKDNLATELYDYVTANGRVCPMPIKWNDFWIALGANQRGSEPPKPIILSGWWYSEDSDKAHRLKEQIAFASQTGILETADRFLRSLKTDEWHYHKNA
jgi:hypothetical protein